jgi:hypothetical protein
MSGALNRSATRPRFRVKRLTERGGWRKCGLPPDWRPQAYVHDAFPPINPMNAPNPMVATFWYQSMTSRCGGVSETVIATMTPSKPVVLPDRQIDLDNQIHCLDGPLDPAHLPENS